MSSDPFSDILRLTRAETVVSGGFSAGGDWAIRFPPFDKMKFCGLVKGACRLWVDGDPTPVSIEEGDVVLLAAPKGFVIGSSAEVAPTAAEDLFDGHATRWVKLGETEEVIQVGGNVRLDPINGQLLADILPPLIHVRAASAQAPVLQWLLRQLLAERTQDLPGSSLAAAEIAQLMLVQILRAHMAEAASSTSGWLRALGDRRLGAALRSMHGEPGRNWSLAELAQAAGMSRTSFAAGFKAAVGAPPLTYLAQWRMQLAERSLREEQASVAMLAQTLGYSSESAFSHAFKRITGVGPKRYRLNVERPS
jgi:AraC-like DNA-binding protein